MRILYILTSLGMGGAEKQALAIAERMARRGHDVALIVLMPPVKEEWATALPKAHLGISRAPASWMAGMARVRRFVCDFNPDLINSHSFHANILARLLKPVIPRAAVISTVHNVYEGSWMRMLTYRLADGLSRQTVIVSEAAAERFIRVKAIPVRKSCVIPNGIDLEEFKPDARRREEFRSDMGLEALDGDGDFVWIAIARIAPAKDLPNLIRAFAKVHAAEHRTRLWVTGEGREQDVLILRRMVMELGVSESVRFLGLRRDIPALLDAADGFVLSSAWEGMPLALGEAMAIEKPVVATDVGGVRELVGNAGIVVPAKDHEALTQAMTAMMRRASEERRVLGRAARERIVQHFSIDVSADKWEALYHTLTPSTNR
jgi:glycosyltransferase involved in cell wall biosynthesis